MPNSRSEMEGVAMVMMEGYHVCSRRSEWEDVGVQIELKSRLAVLMGSRKTVELLLEVERKERR